ncbi:MAG: cobalt ECF transporter T component CbiQ [Methanoculleaceae archaeon]
MSLIDALYELEAQTYRESSVHRLDPRVKIIVAFSAIIAMVAFPSTVDIYLLGGLFGIYIALVWALSRIPPAVYLTRLVTVLPFGLFIIVLQIFFPNPHYPVQQPLVVLPAGITIYAGSVEFASILLVKFLICLSFILLLSSTTRMPDLLSGAARLGMPPEFTLVIGLMIRYLFVFGNMSRRIMRALQSRCFDPFDRRLSYRYRLRQVGYTIGMIFLRSYEQGERTYTAMLCRGYSSDSHLSVAARSICRADIIFFTLSVAFITGTPAMILLLD